MHGMHDPGKPNGMPPLHPRPAPDFMEPSLSKPVRPHPLPRHTNWMYCDHHADEATMHKLCMLAAHDAAGRVLLEHAMPGGPVASLRDARGIPVCCAGDVTVSVTVGLRQRCVWLGAGDSICRAPRTGHSQACAGLEGALLVAMRASAAYCNPSDRLPSRSPWGRPTVYVLTH